MSSNLLLCSDVGFENESRIKLGASSVPGHAAKSVLYSGLMGGDSCHLKQNRKQRPDGRYNSIGDGLETSIRWAYAVVFTFSLILKFKKKCLLLQCKCTDSGAMCDIYAKGLK